MPVALVISDFPIISATARKAFERRYVVLTVTWREYAENRPEHADLVVVDVTTVAVQSALASLRHLAPPFGIVVCSLHHNEVHVYRVGPDGPEIESSLASLLEVTV